MKMFKSTTADRVEKRPEPARATIRLLQRCFVEANEASLFSLACIFRFFNKLTTIKSKKDTLKYLLGAAKPEEEDTLEYLLGTAESEEEANVAAAANSTVDGKKPAAGDKKSPPEATTPEIRRRR